MISAPCEPLSSPSGHLLQNFVHFARILRRLGLAVTPDRVETALRAMSMVDLRRRSEVRDACRAILADRREEGEVFDAAFDLFWRPGIASGAGNVELGRLLRRTNRAKRRIPGALFDAPAGSEGSEDSGEGPEAVDRRRTASAREVLRHKDFAELTPSEEHQLRKLMQEQTVAVGERTTRRTSDSARGARLDLRRTLRRSLARGGELVDLARRRRRKKPRPLVILCDVSGSMESYSRILLQFLYAAARAGTAGAEPGGRREAFAFGTRLTRLTPTLRHRELDRALREATAAVTDWGGGTRIGEALGRFNRDWASRVLGAEAVVLIISDGWDRGEPEVLAREMARLRRSCERMIWLNPLVASPGYEPLARGMAAALPFVDELLPVHNLQSLEDLRERLASLELRPRRARSVTAEE